MGTAIYGGVYADIPLMPQSSFLASSFPIVAPLQQSGQLAQFVVDTPGAFCLTHNATNTVPPIFTIYTWSDAAKFWIPLNPLACAASMQINFKILGGTRIYIASSVALTGGASAFVIVGGVTIQGNSPLISAGV